MNSEMLDGIIDAAMGEDSKNSIWASEIKKHSKIWDKWVDESGLKEDYNLGEEFKKAYQQEPMRSKKLTDDKKDFLEWLIFEDITESSKLYGILTPEQSDFLVDIIKTGWYDMEERVRIKNIVEPIRKVIADDYSAYLKKKNS